MDRQARQVVTEVVGAYLRDPDQLPARFASRVPSMGLERVVCDYVAGMTDRFCRAERDRLV